MKFLPLFLAILRLTAANLKDEEMVKAIRALFKEGARLDPGGPRNDLEWTDDNDISKFLPPAAMASGKHKAFRDIFGEVAVKKLFDSYMEKVNHPLTYGHQMISDPLRIRRGIHLTKKGDIFSIDLKASKMSAEGLRQLNLDYIRVVRHWGLRDIKVDAMVKAGDLISINGEYELKGSAVGFLALSGSGNFSINLKKPEILAASFAVAGPKIDGQPEDRKLVFKNLDVQMVYDNVDFQFQNMMGGGVVGSTINLVINAMGGAIVESQKLELIKSLRDTFKNIISHHL